MTEELHVERSEDYAEGLHYFILEIFSLCIELKKLLNHITFIIYKKHVKVMFFESVPKNTQKH